MYKQYCKITFSLENLFHNIFYLTSDLEQKVVSFAHKSQLAFEMQLINCG